MRPAPTIERRPDALARLARALVRPVPRDPARRDVREREAQSRAVSVVQVGRRAEEDTGREHDHRRERRRDEDRAKIVEHVEPETELVETPRPVQREAEERRRSPSTVDGGEATPAAMTPELHGDRREHEHRHIDRQAAERPRRLWPQPRSGAGFGE